MCVVDNMEIGNGYGVLGGGVYYNGVCLLMFILVVDFNMYKLDFNGLLGRFIFDGRYFGYFEGLLGIFDGGECFNVVGVWINVFGVVDE